ncbi:MAG: hypothetical protein WC582_02845 [Patescibacteria group bacterium]
MPENPQIGGDGVSLSEETDVSGVRGKRPKIPVPRWVIQYAHELGKSIADAQRELMEIGFPATNIGL